MVRFMVKDKDKGDSDGVGGESELQLKAGSSKRLMKEVVKRRMKKKITRDRKVLIRKRNGSQWARVVLVE